MSDDVRAFELLLDVMDRACEIPTLNAPIIPYPAGRLFWGGAVPGTSCQATIAPSLRDISQQASARSRNRFVPQSFLSSDSDPDPRVPKPPLSSRRSIQGPSLVRFSCPFKGHPAYPPTESNSRSWPQPRPVQRWLELLADQRPPGATRRIRPSASDSHFTTRPI